MADSDFDPTQYGATSVEEQPPFDPTQHGAIPVEAPAQEQPSGFEKVLGAAQQGLGYAQKGLQLAMNPGAEIHKLMFPAEAKLTEQPLISAPTLTSIVHGLQTPQRAILKGAFGDTGERLSEASGRFLGEQLSGLTSPESLALLAVAPAIGKLGGIRPPPVPESLAEVAGIAKPEVPPETVTPEPITPVATDAAEVQPVPEVAPSVPAAESVVTAPLPPETTSLGKVEPVAPDLPTGTGEAFNLQADVPRPEPQVPSTFSVQMPTDAFGTEQTPVASALQEMGGVLSKSGAKKAGKLEGNTALWDDVQPLSHPTHNKIYSLTGETPDVAAQTLHDSGLISDPSPTTMWKAVADESKSSRNILKSQQGEIETQKFKLQETSKQAQDFGKAQKEGWKGGEPVVPVRDLQVGDHVTVKGEQLKVVDIDPDSFDVTLEDGRKFGVQTVKDNTVLYGEHETPSVAPKLLSGETQGDLISSTQKEPFALVGEKGTDFASQQAALEKSQVERAQSEKGQTDLFKPTEGGIENATQEGQQQESSITEHPGVPQGSDLPAHGEEVRQGQGERAGGSGSVEPAAQEQVIPKDAIATVQFKDTNGNPVQKKMNARDAEGIFTKERSSYKALLDCLGA